MKKAVSSEQAAPVAEGKASPGMGKIEERVLQFATRYYHDKINAWLLVLLKAADEAMKGLVTTAPERGDDDVVTNIIVDLASAIIDHNYRPSKSSWYGELSPAWMRVYGESEPVSLSDADDDELPF